MKVICEGCGQPFETKRADAKACSPKCRKAISRKADESIITTHELSPMTVNKHPVKVAPSSPVAAPVGIEQALKYCTANKISLLDLVDFHKLNVGHKCPTLSLKHALDTSDVKSDGKHNMSYQQERLNIKLGRSSNPKK